VTLIPDVPSMKIVTGDVFSGMTQRLWGPARSPFRVSP
jgi:hypothetical protein